MLCYGTHDEVLGTGRLWLIHGKQSRHRLGKILSYGMDCLHFTGVGYDHLTVRAKKRLHGVEKTILRFSHLPRMVFGKPDYQCRAQKVSVTLGGGIACAAVGRARGMRTRVWLLVSSKEELTSWTHGPADICHTYDYGRPRDERRGDGGGWHDYACHCDSDSGNYNG